MARHSNLNSRRTSRNRSRGDSAGNGWCFNPQRGFRKLRLEALEDRRLLAHDIRIAIGGASTVPAAALTFSDNTDVTIDPSALATATTAVDLQANNDISFQDPVSVHSGIALTAEANDAILVNNSLATSGAGLTLNAGSGGISAVAAGVIASDSAVTLNTSGPIGSPGNPLQFADNPNPAQQNVVIGSTDQPSSVFIAGLGSLTLGNVEGGPTCTQIDVTARTNLVVAPGATINSGGAPQSQPTGIIGSNHAASELSFTGWDGPSMALLPDGKVLVVYGVWGQHLDWRISSDDGRTWGAATTFHTVATPRTGPVGCTVLADGTILLMVNDWVDSGGNVQNIYALRGTYNSGTGTITWSSPSLVAGPDSTRRIRANPVAVGSNSL